MLGISHPSGKYFVELRHLDEKHQIAFLRDWLMKEGQAINDPSSWIEAVMKETHGWPQHIISYADQAIDQLKTDQNMITTDWAQCLTGKSAGCKSEVLQVID